ncbi:Glutamate receptor [Echinococcus granulosus]|uniref:Glutamate receptor n=1 Tax=Echinococcus granulosus TaxID=6210 RepID=W6UTS0_ECHGR|nr:Glutamate receptor [Echinococcus granulosus]EUB56819.1 Glutamate receptor [Echinococcus granulosus]
MEANPEALAPTVKAGVERVISSHSSALSSPGAIPYRPFDVLLTTTLVDVASGCSCERVDSINEVITCDRGDPGPTSHCGEAHHLMAQLKEDEDKSSIKIFQQMWKFMEANPEALAPTVKAGVERVINSNKDYAFILESTMNEYFNQRRPCTTIKVRDS